MANLGDVGNLLIKKFLPPTPTKTTVTPQGNIVTQPSKANALPKTMAPVSTPSKISSVPVATKKVSTPLPTPNKWIGEIGKTVQAGISGLQKGVEVANTPSVKNAIAKTVKMSEDDTVAYNKWLQTSYNPYKSGGGYLDVLLPQSDSRKEFDALPKVTKKALADQAYQEIEQIKKEGPASIEKSQFNLKVGALKGIGSTALSLGKIGASAMGSVLNAATGTELYKPSKTSDEIIKSALEPKNIEETIGYGAENMLEFFIPQGAVGKIAKGTEVLAKTLGLSGKAAKAASVAAGLMSDITASTAINMAKSGSTDVQQNLTWGPYGYGLISKSVGNALKAIPKVGNFMSAHPIVSSYVIQNLGEEVVESGVRKAIGQNYDWNNFMQGMVMGMGMQYGVSSIEAKKALGQVENLVHKAAETKNAPVTTREFYDIVYNSPLKGNQTFGDVFNQRLAFKTGTGSISDMKGTQLKSMAKRPSVTDIGVTIPEKPANIINTVNPTNGLFVDYTPELRANAELGKNITTLDKTSGGSPDDMITIYRGAPKSQAKINSGDFITTNKQLAKDYAGNGNVISEIVRKGDILDDITEPLGEEYIYRPRKPKTQPPEGSLAFKTGGKKELTAGDISEAAKRKVELPSMDYMKEIADSGYNEVPKEFNIERTGKELKIPKPYEFKPEFMKEKKKALDIPKKQLAKEGLTDFDVNDYVNEMKKLALAEQPTVAKTIKEKVSSFYTDVKSKLVDYAAPIEDAIRSAEKKHGFKVLPANDITAQIDKVLRSPTLAGQFMDDNGLANVIKNVDNLDHFNEYLKAKQSIDVSNRGIETGRNINKDKQLVSALDSKYTETAKQVTDYSRKLLDYSVDSGLISSDLAATLKEIYPNYVPLNRIFSELETIKYEGGKKGIAGLSKQTVVQKLEGSTKQIEDPISSLMTKTNDAFSQGERNKAGRILAGYKDLPGFEDKIVELKKGEKAPYTISYLENGEKRTFKTTKEISEAAKRLNVEQVGLLLRILQVPVRLFKTGTTGLELSFFMSNIAKDQFTALINSQKGIKTSIANPANFARSLFSVLKEDDLYKEMVREGAGGTSFDIARPQVKETVERIRSQRNLPSRIKYTVTHPSEMLRTIENIIGKSEELTRMTQYKGMKDALIKEGMNENNAKIVAAKAARENTANFSRKGEWGNVINTVPYLNAGIQGSRAFVRSFARDPASTSFKLASTLLLPTAVVTAWNLNDEKRKEAYNDIQEYEKDGNFVIIPPNPTKDERTGKWNVIKVPMPPGISSLAAPVRGIVEQANGLDSVKFGDFATALINSVNPVGVSPDRPLETLVGSLTPQILKPSIEVITNKSMYTGSPIIPRNLENVEPKYQIKDNTSGIAKRLGEQFNISPLQIDYLIKGYGGKLSSELTGGISPLEAVEGRFTKAAGGLEMQKAYEAEAVATKETTTENYLIKKSIDDIIKRKDKKALIDYYTNAPADKKSYVEQYMTTQMEGLAKTASGMSKLEKRVSEMNGDEAIQYFKSDIDQIIKTKDKKALLNILSALDSDKAKEKLFNYFLENVPQSR